MSNHTEDPIVDIFLKRSYHSLVQPLAESEFEYAN